MLGSRPLVRHREGSSVFDFGIIRDDLMASKRRFTVLVTFVLLSQISFSSQQITSVDSHLVAVRGSKVILRCVHSLTTNAVYWIHRRPGELRVHVVSEGRAEAGEVQYIIESVNFNHSGNYKCQDQNGHASTELTVVSDNSSCRHEPVSPEVAEQEVVTFTCRLSYSGNSAPYLRWTDSDRNPKEDSAVRRSLEIESRINVTIGRFDVRPYLVSVCPTDTGTKCLPLWQSPSLRIFVSVVNVTIAMVTLNTDGGRMALNCSAVGCPTPSYIWEDAAGKITQGSIVLLSDSLQGPHTYKCIAWNTFRSRNYTAESSIDIYIPERTSSSSTEPTAANPFMANISDAGAFPMTATALASEVFVIDGFLVRVIGAGLLILVAIVAFACVCIAAILFSRRRRRRQREPGRRSDSDSNDESTRKSVVEVSQNETVLHISLATESDRSLQNPTSDVYEVINDNDYEKYSNFIGTTPAANEGRRYLPLNCVASIEYEGEIQMPSEYMTTLAVTELKTARQTASSEPIIQDHHYLQVLP